MMLKLLALLAVLLCLSPQTEGWEKNQCHDIALNLTSAMMSASSQLDPSHSAAHAVLNSPGGWSALNTDVSPWFKVKFSDLTMVSGVHTQGRSDVNEWTTNYEFWYSIDNNIFHAYQNSAQSGPKQFTGNHDRNTVKKNLLDRPYIVAQYMQIRPKRWIGQHASMRIQLMGCPQSSNVHVECTTTHMTIFIHVDILRGLSASDLHLNLPNCTATAVTIGPNNYYRLTTPLDGCNTTCAATKTFITYFNRVTEKLMFPGQVIWRTPRVSIPFTCTYRTNKVKTTIPIKPNLNVTFISEHGIGEFPCTIAIYRTSKYLLKITNGPLHVQLRQRIYLQITFTSGDRHLWIRASRCYGSPTNNPKSTPQYNLILDGCKTDNTVIMYNRTSPKIQRFSFESFVLLKHHVYLYIHCVVKVCKGYTHFCAKQCPNKRKRGMAVLPSDGPEHVVTNGPLILHGYPHPSDIKRDASYDEAAALLGEDVKIESGEEKQEKSLQKNDDEKIDEKEKSDDDDGDEPVKNEEEEMGKQGKNEEDEMGKHGENEEDEMGKQGENEEDEMGKQGENDEEDEATKPLEEEDGHQDELEDGDEDYLRDL